MTFNVTSSAIGVDLDNTNTTQLFALGTHVNGTANSEWVYVQASGTISCYKGVAFNSSYTCGMASCGDVLGGLQIGVAQTAFASSAYGWVAIRGNMNVYTTGSATATAQGIYLAASASPTGAFSNLTSASGTVAGISFTNVTTQTAAATITAALLSWPRGGAPGM